MPLIRILVDGYSLLHAWPELAPKSARHSAMARDALIARLEEYQAALGTPITVFFDGQSGGLSSRTKSTDPREVEVLYSKAGQTADDLIERAAYRFKAYGEVLVITDDHAERDHRVVAQADRGNGGRGVFEDRGGANGNRHR